MVTASKEIIMPLKQSGPSGQPPLVEQVIEPAERPFTDAVRALLKAGYLLANHPMRPNHAYDLTVAQIDVLNVLAGAETESLSCSEIAERTLITKGGITG